MCLESVFESSAKLEQCMEVFKKRAVLTSEFLEHSLLVFVQPCRSAKTKHGSQGSLNGSQGRVPPGIP